MPEALRMMTLSLDPGHGTLSGQAYWKRNAALYEHVGQGREKALEHSLTFELLDFHRVRRYCDIAAATSQIERVLSTKWPGIEFWRQDFSYRTDLEHRILGGLAQDMAAVPAGFFDALTLHCSLEHFSGRADGEFVTEVDRVLSDIGACLIVPLYVAKTPRVYFDPTATTASQLQEVDPEAQLRALRGYGQEHGRFYSPETLAARVINRLPPSLCATLLRFTGQELVAPEIYLQFGLVLHRRTSVFATPAL